MRQLAITLMLGLMWGMLTQAHRVWNCIMPGDAIEAQSQAVVNSQARRG